MIVTCPERSAPVREALEEKPLRLLPPPKPELPPKPLEEPPKPLLVPRLLPRPPPKVELLPLLPERDEPLLLPPKPEEEEVLRRLLRVLELVWLVPRLLLVVPLKRLFMTAS